MKLTVNLDGELLDRVVELTGSRTKTQAIMTALRELAWPLEREGTVLPQRRAGPARPPGPEDRLFYAKT